MITRPTLHFRSNALRVTLATLCLASCLRCFGGWQVPLDGQGGSPPAAAVSPTPGADTDSDPSDGNTTPTPTPTAATGTATDANTMDANAMNANSVSTNPNAGNANTVADANCQPIAAFFEAQMWTPIMSTTCVSCHQDSSNPFHLTPGDPNTSLTATEAEAQKTGTNNTSLLLLKPTGQTSHGGGTLFSTTSSTYMNFQAFVTAVQTNAACITPP